MSQKKEPLSPQATAFEPQSDATIARQYADSTELNDAWRVMHFALRAVIAEPDRMLALRGLTRVHHRILFFVAREPAMSVGALQTLLDVTKQALNTPLKQLQTQGLIDFITPKHDARVRQLQLTESGVALESQLTGEQQRLFLDAFSQAGDGAKQGWFDVMTRLAARLKT